MFLLVFFLPLTYLLKCQVLIYNLSWILWYVRSWQDKQHLIVQLCWVCSWIRWNSNNKQLTISDGHIILLVLAKCTDPQTSNGIIKCTFRNVNCRVVWYIIIITGHSQYHFIYKSRGLINRKIKKKNVSLGLS